MNELYSDGQHHAIVSLHIIFPHISCHLSSWNSMISRSEVADRRAEPAAWVSLGWR